MGYRLVKIQLRVRLILSGQSFRAGIQWRHFATPGLFCVGPAPRRMSRRAGLWGSRGRLAAVLFYPASGAFVSLSQATLMDVEPERREHNMACWALAWGFRHSYSHSGVGASGFKSGVGQALRTLRRKEVLRWLTLLHFSDLMLDVLLGFLALYFTDVVGTSGVQAGVAVAIWTGVGLVGDFLLILLLERVSGLRYLRWSAALELLLFPAFLLAGPAWVKLGLLALLGLFNAGWYSILKAQLYAAVPGQSGAVMAAGNVFGWAGRSFPLILAFVAEGWGLGTAMWLLWLGPLALPLGLPSVKRKA